MAIEQNPFIDNETDAIGKVISPAPKPEKDIGIDTKDLFYQNIISAGQANAIDIGAIEAFTTISNSRDLVYNLLDTMAEDSTVSAILEAYAEDSTEYNDEGRIVWVDSSDSNVAQYVDFLLKTLKVDKNIYKWAYSLCKYGDVYLRLYRKSEYYDILFDDIYDDEEEEKPYVRGRNTLNEDVIKEDLRNQQRRLDDAQERPNLTEEVFIKAYAKNDKYVRYLEMVPNPAEVFELTKFGKTHAYIQASINSLQGISTNASSTNMGSANYYHYRFKKSDVKIYQPTEFVHGCLESNSSRTPEEVQIFIPRPRKKKRRKKYKNPNGEWETDYTDNVGDDTADSSESDELSSTYSVKRGQALLYDLYKIWRQLSLLENALMLSRLTRSSLVRIIQIEVGDMPKESVGVHLMNIKSLIEQKSAITAGGGMNEYTNPGAIENCIYVPTHNGVGNITMSTIGGDYNVRDIADLDYYQDKFFGAAKVPKQYFGVTGDGAGFDGGKSLALLSSRYAKTIKRIQNTLIQMITDAINLILLNDGLENYVNKFTIKMLPPTTQEEIDRRENFKNRISYVRDTMDLFNDIDNTAMKLKLLKALLSSAITDPEVISLIQEQIDNIETEQEEIENEVTESEKGTEEEEKEAPKKSRKKSPPPSEEEDSFDNMPLDLDTPSTETEAPSVPASEPSGEAEFSSLPSGADLGIDLTSFGI